MDIGIYEEIEKIAGLIMPGKQRIAKHSVCDEYVIFVNHSAVSKMFTCAILLLAKQVDSIKAHVILMEQKAADFVNEYCENTFLQGELTEVYNNRIFLYHSLAEFSQRDVVYTYQKVRFCTFLDAADEDYKKINVQQQYLADIETILELASKSEYVKFVHTARIPAIKPLPGGMTAISEREYEVYASQFPEHSPEQLVLKTEELIRKYAKEGLKAVATRMDNVFGPGIENPWMDRLVSDYKEKNAVVLETGMFNYYIGCNYIRFAAVSVFVMFVKGKGGNIYNLQQFRTTPYHIAFKAYDYLAAHGAKLECDNSRYEEASYCLLCNKKMAGMFLPKYTRMTLDEVIYQTCVSKLDLEYIIKNDIFRYDGKLDEIKKIEIEVMEEIKRICEKHGIKYFLVGGSMLGAVRHKGFIPWDDDLDVGMLREDYEKFRRVAPQELDERYTYQSYRTEKDSHYIFDKIRLKDTFFTTKFSNMFEMENGLFIDILVYDKTAKSPFFQKLHILLLRSWVRLINIRWVNRPRKKVFYRFSKIFLPLMRLFPLGFYHAVFNWMLNWFNHSNSKWAIDGVGQNLYKGAFPIEWLEDTIDVPFENTTFPIPVHYDEYLRHWYGDHYMELLPISKRNSGHIMKRIDLGSYITNMGFEEGNYHHASAKGELYDYFDEE